VIGPPETFVQLASVVELPIVVHSKVCVVTGAKGGEAIGIGMVLRSCSRQSSHGMRWNEVEVVDPEGTVKINNNGPTFHKSSCVRFS